MLYRQNLNFVDSFISSLNFKKKRIEIKKKSKPLYKGCGQIVRDLIVGDKSIIELNKIWSDNFINLYLILIQFIKNKYVKG